MFTLYYNRRNGDRLMQFLEGESDRITWILIWGIRLAPPTAMLTVCGDVVIAERRELVEVVGRAKWS